MSQGQRHTRHNETSGARRAAGGVRGWLRGLFLHHQEVAVDSLQRLLRERAATFMTWVVIGIALALPLSLALLVSNLQQLSGGIDRAARITLYLDRGAAEEATQSLRERVAAREDVSEVEFIGADSALAEFEERSGFGEALRGLDENPLPAVLLVTPASLDAGAVEPLVAALEEEAVVESAQLDMAWVQRLNSALSLMQRLTFGLALLLAAGVLLVIGNTVRLAIENRRAEIVVVKLVGGTDAYVSRPFLYTGFWYGAGGGVMGCLLILLVVVLLKGPVAQLTGLYESDFALQGPGLSDVLLVVLGSGLLGWLGAWISVLRHLRDIEPR